jgi:hypothetical protein
MRILQLCPQVERRQKIAEKTNREGVSGTIAGTRGKKGAILKIL